MKKLKILLSVIMSLVILISIYPQRTYAYSLSGKARNWGYVRNNKHQAPSVSKETIALFKKYDGHYTGNKKEKIVYLTFDLGYENGCTTKILNVLKKHKINATFFVCKGFIDHNSKGLKRMVKEGNVVANHTVNHIAFYKLSESKLKSELKNVEIAYKKVIGNDMIKFVRPPEGGFSEKSLALSQKLGYTTIFWSIALPNDWNLKQQPSKEATLSLFKNQYHNGAIILLHGVSPTVADNLDQMISVLEDKGYEFKLINDGITSNKQ